MSRINAHLKECYCDIGSGTPAQRFIDADALPRGRYDLGAVLEMHRVVVIPLAAPDEAMLLENMDDLQGNLVSIGIAAVGIGLRP